MWSRITMEEWVGIFKLIAFIVTFPVFCWIIYRVLRMKQSDVDHSANLPLDDEAPSEPENDKP